MIREEICTYEVCKLAKEKGFNVDCEAFYYNDGFLQYAKFENWNGRYINKFSAPTQSLLQRWLREEKKWNIVVRMYEDKGYYWFVQNSKGQLQTSYFTYADEMFTTYEHALEDALKYALENLV